MNVDQERRKLFTVTLVLGLLALGIRLFSSQPHWVERYYATGIYPWIGTGMRHLFGWIPFSMGDILYLLAITWLVYLIIKVIRSLFRSPFKWANIKESALRLIQILLGIYIYFNLFWGLNYNRLGISYQLDLRVPEKPDNKLAELANRLLVKTNTYASAAGRSRSLSKERIISGSIQGYKNLQPVYPFLAYHPHSVKSSLFGVLGNYMGYTGYYNPFTAEAQVNEAVPEFLHPFVACHEIAHQLGYAKENEANFVGFLAAKSSGDTAFRYSAYMDMFLYANAELYRTDSVLARQNLKKLFPEVQRDLAELRAYRIKYDNPLDKLISIFYDRYLRMNQQPDGERTYSKVVLWLLAYYDKFGEI